MAQVRDLLKNSSITLGAQDISSAVSGAYTGEISATMLAEFSCRFAIIGHSERRQYHAESDAIVAEKFIAAQKEIIKPVLCIGESLEERESGAALEVISTQLKAVINAVGLDAFNEAVIAYEPVWAIGTGKTASPEQAQEVHKHIRSLLGSTGDKVQILYGGSVKSSNATELFSQPDIDGALVGGASLDANEFTLICQAADQ
jgi:triosephosphate isomerase